MKLLWKAVALEVGVQAHPQKFWFAENLRKILENPVTNDDQDLQKNTCRPFLKFTPKRGLDISGRKFFRQKLHKNFSGNSGKFGQKSFAPHKFACSYTYDEKASPPSLPPFERTKG